MLSRRLTLITAATLFLASCAYTHVTAENASTLSSEDLCGYIRYQGAQDMMIGATMIKTRDAVKAEVSKRKLDCSAGHQKCTSFGLKKGTKAYADCRLELEKQDNDNRARTYEWDRLDSLFQRKLDNDAVYTGR